MDQLQIAFERFIDDGDADSLLAAIDEWGQVKPDSSLDTPVAHRICDIDLKGVAYRVVRVADPHDRATRLYIYETNTPDYEQPGVPISLKDVALFNWIEDELANPTEWKTDWRQYGQSLAGDD